MIGKTRNKKRNDYSENVKVVLELLMCISVEINFQSLIFSSLSRQFRFSRDILQTLVRNLPKTWLRKKEIKELEKKMSSFPFLAPNTSLKHCFPSWEIISKSIVRKLQEYAFTSNKLAVLFTDFFVSRHRIILYEYTSTLSSHLM